MFASYKHLAATRNAVRVRKASGLSSQQSAPPGTGRPGATSASTLFGPFWFQFLGLSPQHHALIYSTISGSMHM